MITVGNLKKIIDYGKNFLAIQKLEKISQTMQKVY